MSMNMLTIVWNTNFHRFLCHQIQHEQTSHSEPYRPVNDEHKEMIKNMKRNLIKIK